MKLSAVDRVIYQRNPLIEVISQLRFPPILKIANQDPVEFQDAVRDDYPLLEIAKNVLLIDNRAPSSSEPQQLDTVYHFKSEDLNWKATLGQGFIALSTKNYERYEDFRQRFAKIISTFEELYTPAFYSRVGLRYQDLIVRSALGLDDEPWSTLIPAYIAPELHRPEIFDDVMASTKTWILKSNKGQVAFRHGLVEARDADQGLLETAYLLDVDFFTEERVGRGSHVWDYLDEYNQSARNLFRWSIEEKLHLAMDPQPA